MAHQLDLIGLFAAFLGGPPFLGFGDLGRVLNKLEPGLRFPKKVCQSRGAVPVIGFDLRLSFGPRQLSFEGFLSASRLRDGIGISPSENGKKLGKISWKISNMQHV